MKQEWAIIQMKKLRTGDISWLLGFGWIRCFRYLPRTALLSCSMALPVQGPRDKTTTHHLHLPGTCWLGWSLRSEPMWLSPCFSPDFLSVLPSYSVKLMNKHKASVQSHRAHFDLSYRVPYSAEILKVYPSTGYDHV